MVLASLFACQQSEDLNEDILSNTVTTELTKSGEWHITYFDDSGKDETDDFTEFRFTFKEDGTLQVSGGALSINGTWAIDKSQSSDPDDVELILDFGISDPLEELNDDWDVISISNAKIELIDISGGNGGTYYLTFEK